jgi:RsiW-degrading membrane proteinase PrsW (M82 family)
MRSRQGNEPSKSQLLPLGSAWQELMTKGYFWPGVMACLGLTLLWVTLSNRSLKLPVSLGYITVQVPMYYAFVALLLTAGGAFAIYRMVGKQKAWWLVPAVILFSAMLTESPVMGGLQKFFAIFGPARGDGSIPGEFIYHLFRAALPEEVLKSISVAIGVFIGVKLLDRLSAQHPARQLAVLEPIDGLLIGAASGFGFAFSETLLGYVPMQMLNSPDVANQMLGFLSSKGLQLKIPADMSLPVLIHELFGVIAKLIGPDGAEALVNQFIVRGQGRGLELMLPRLFGDVFGHAAYAGVFGYFIGLATMKPANRAKTILIGLATACVLHASWNASASASSLFLFVCALAAFVMLAVCIVKARQISPERSQLIASQIISRAPAAPVPPAQPVAPRPTAAAPATAPAAAPAAAKPVAGGSITWDDDSNQRIVEIGSARIPAAVGARLWERQAPGASASRGDGVVGEVNANPSDPSVLGLKNLSQQPWEVTLPDGTRRELAPGRSIRIEVGMKLKIGDLVAVVR